MSSEICPDNFTAMKITRHYLTIKNAESKRRVHYRKCGDGPPVLLIHQSPRSSAEYETVMRQWGERFTCIAPDSPGFGQSDPLPVERPSTADYADAIIAFADAAGFRGIAAYGFHSGGIFLMNALRRYPEKFVALGVGGYPCFREDELADVGEDYLPPFAPKEFGEHLVWAWNRMLEQSWYFPWFKPENSRRLPNPHADPVALQNMVMDLLASGDSYRDGYRAALTAGFDVPAATASVPPAFLSSYHGDPMTAHMKRFPALPSGWTTQEQSDPPSHFAANADFLEKHPAPAFTPATDEDAGFLHVSAGGFDGLIHWQGAGKTLHLHAPGRSLDVLSASGRLKIDLPGHGLSDPWGGEPPVDYDAWQRVISVVCAHFNVENVESEPLPKGEPDLLYPDLNPDRFGGHLVKAWAIVRAAHVFEPWYATARDNAVSIDTAAMAADKLAREHLALIRSSAAKALHIARLSERMI